MPRPSYVAFLPLSVAFTALGSVAEARTSVGHRSDPGAPKRRALLTRLGRIDNVRMLWVSCNRIGTRKVASVLVTGPVLG